MPGQWRAASVLAPVLVLQLLAVTAPPARAQPCPSVPGAVVAQYDDSAAAGTAFTLTKANGDTLASTYLGPAGQEAQSRWVGTTYFFFRVVCHLRAFLSRDNVPRVRYGSLVCSCAFVCQVACCWRGCLGTPSPRGSLPGGGCPVTPVGLPCVVGVATHTIARTVRAAVRNEIGGVS